MAVSWDAALVDGTSQTADGYYVERLQGQRTTPACGSSPSNLLSASAIGCTDTGSPSGGIAAGTYTYEVVAVLASWTATRASGPVQVAGPSITSVDPSSAEQGANNVTVTIDGSKFDGDASVAFANPGVMVDSVTDISQSTLTANITIASSASLGATSVAVENPDGDQSTATFTVEPGPTITAVTPDEGAQGDTQTVTITGSGFKTGAQASFSSTGITVNSTSYTSSTTLTANITIAQTATKGAAAMSVINTDGSTTTLSGTFTVDAAPTARWAGTSHYAQSATSGSAIIVGTGFEPGATVSFTNPGVTVVSGPVVHATDVTLTIAVSSSATVGATYATITNPDGGAATAPFTVDPAPTLTALSPDDGQVGDTAQVTLTGAGLSLGGFTAETSNPAIGVYVAGSGNPVDLTIPASVTPGPVTLTATNSFDGSNASATFWIEPDTQPTQALSLAGATGAYLNNGTLYYNGGMSGSFELQDQVGDPYGSAASSVLFPDVATSGWNHAVLLNGFPPIKSITSGTFSWTANPSNPSGYGITADLLDGGSGETDLTFADDASPPTGAAFSVDGAAATASGSMSTSNSPGFTIGSRTDYTETQTSSQSGLASSILTVQSETLSGTTCGVPGSGGPFTTAATITGTTQPSGIVGGYCYLYTLTGTDNVANTASITTTVAVPAIAQVAGSPFANGNYPLAVRFSPSGGLLATANENGNVSVFSVAGSGALTQLAHASVGSGKVFFVAFSPSGGLLAAPDPASNSVSVFSVDSSGALTPAGSPTSTGANSAPYTVAFSPDGKFLAAADAASNSVSVFSVDSS